MSDRSALGPHGRSRRSVATPGWLALAFGAYVTCFAVGLRTDQGVEPLVLAAVSTLLFLVLLFVLRQAAPAIRHLSVVIVGGGLLLQAVALTAGPTSSDDAYRYVWDGKVQLAGIDPYTYAPQDPELAALRDPDLFGPTSACTYPIPSGGCTVINRPSVHTVYPPVAQVSFDVVRIASFGGMGGVFPFQLAAALGSALISMLLVARLRAAGRGLWLTAVWAWSPIVVIEFGNNAHLDWLAVALGLLSLQAARADRPARAGLLAGAAILTKIYPGLLLPAIARSRPVVVLGSAVAVIVLAYIPHLVASGGAVVGYLPGYLHEEGYQSGSRLLLIGIVLPHPVDVVVAAAVLAVVAWYCYSRSDPTRPELGATTMVGATFLVVTPAYGWYAALLIALIAWSGRLEWLPTALAPTFVYLVRTEVTQSAVPAAILYALAAGTTIALAVLRRTPVAASATRADA